MRIDPNVDEIHQSKWQAHGRRLWLPFCSEPEQHTLEYLPQRDELRGVHMKFKGAAKTTISMEAAAAYVLICKISIMFWLLPYLLNIYFSWCNSKRDGCTGF
jgi:hypothetical protein